MTSIRVSNTLDDLTSDTRKIAVTTPRRLSGIVRTAARVGNTVARDNARRTAGSHGKLYPRAFSWEMRGLLEAEYGPDASKPQGDMNFETGSRNQPPHNDIAHSADLIVPGLAHDVHDMLDEQFWPA